MLNRNTPKLLIRPQFKYCELPHARLGIDMFSDMPAPTGLSHVAVRSWRYTHYGKR